MNFISFILLITFVKISQASICEICKCLTTDASVEVDCKGRKLSDTEIFRYSYEINRENRTITSIDLSFNVIDSIPAGSFQNLENLKVLDLSHNNLKDIHSNAFKNLKSLEVLNLSHNKFKSIPLTYLPSLRSMNLSYNLINDSTIDAQTTFPQLVKLDLSSNLLKNLLNGLSSFKTLQSLNLSSNNISSLASANLPQILNLTVLDIRNNSIASLLNDELPTKLKSLNVGFNNLTKLPENIKNIKILNIEHNCLTNLNISNSTGNNLNYLNIRGNGLESFPNVLFSELITLDLSANKFETISTSINNDNLPKLKNLDISENPLEEIKFNSKLQVESITVRNVSTIEKISEDAFKELSSPSNGCMNITLSGHKNLTNISDHVFDGLNVCFLDLSGNGFTRFSSNLTHKIMQSAKYGIDLQGNPFDCNCSMQWMLNDLVPWLYNSHQNLLIELRCAPHSEFRNLRMVHWLKWKRQVFCEDKTSESVVGEPASVFSGISLNTSSAMLVIVISSIIVILVVFIVAIVLIKKAAIKRNRRNRRL